MQRPEIHNIFVNSCGDWREKLEEEEKITKIINSVRDDAFEEEFEILKIEELIFITKENIFASTSSVSTRCTYTLSTEIPEQEIPKWAMKVEIEFSKDLRYKIPLQVRFEKTFIEVEIDHNKLPASETFSLVRYIQKLRDKINKLLENRTKELEEKIN